MRIVYLGTPDEAVPPLRALHGAGHEIVLVITRPDARRSRRGDPAPSPVKQAALDLGLDVASTVEEVTAGLADLGVVVAYGRIIPSEILAVLPMVNLHFSKLPRWRGAAPVERAILNGDTETAVSVMAMESGLDTGPIHAETVVPIASDDTTATLKERLVTEGASLLVQTLATGLGEPAPQVGEPVYANKITTEDRRIDWTAPTAAIDAQIRVGRAHTTLNGQRFLIWRAVPQVGQADRAPGQLFNDASGPGVATVDGSLALVEVQPGGRPRMPADAWWHGARPEGVVLGELP